MFSVVDAVVLRPFAFVDQARLVLIGTTVPAPRGEVSYPDILDWRGGLSSVAALGACARIGAARVVQPLLFGVGARDPRTLVLAATILVTTAGVACLLPARRAVGIDPIAVLRDE